MGLLETTVIVNWHSKTKRWYESKGYVFTKMKDCFEITVGDLPEGSGVLVKVGCDSCGKVTNKQWASYLRLTKRDGKYHCHKCSMKLYGSEETTNSKLHNTLSFKLWCENNNRHDIIARWNYELNNLLPELVCYSSGKKYWFNCPMGIHIPEEKKLDVIVQNENSQVKCKQCNSFAQWGNDTVCADFLEKYWDWNKNSEAGIDPWEIGHKSHKKIWVKCQKKEHHGSYEICCEHFVVFNQRCVYCTNKNNKVHPMESLGQHILDNFGEEHMSLLWSDKNSKSPFEYTKKSGEEVFWKCSNGIHEDYKRCIYNSYSYHFRCPRCSFSKGEERIEKFILLNHIDYIPQVTSDNINKMRCLLGVHGGLLSYDFFLPKYNLLIEYQGEYHDGTAGNQSKADFEIQLEHDRRKRDYAIMSNKKILEIWYWDFDNIEEILSCELQPDKGDEVLSLS